MLTLLHSVTDKGEHESFSFAAIRDLKPFLIFAYFKYFTLQVHKEINENTRIENRFQIFYFIATLWLIMY